MKSSRINQTYNLRDVYTVLLWVGILVFALGTILSQYFSTFNQFTSEAGKLGKPTGNFSTEVSVQNISGDTMLKNELPSEAIDIDTPVIRPHNLNQTIEPLVLAPVVASNESEGSESKDSHGKGAGMVLPLIASTTAKNNPVTDASAPYAKDPALAPSFLLDKKEFLSYQINISSPAPAPSLVRKQETKVLDKLDTVLERTADKNKTVIITALNGAWAEENTMIDLFLESFHIGEGTEILLNHLLIVALDAKAYKRCLKIHHNCYTLRTRGIDFTAEKVYMSEDYLKMMWRRLGFLGDILRRGYSFVFSDADIMWLRNPFWRFSPDADIQIASDMFNGNPEDVSNLPNGGFKFVRSNERTIAFYKYWYMSRYLYPGENEQTVLNIVKMKSSFGRRNMKFLFMDTKYFGGYCERSQYLADVYTMHANCCKGLRAKLVDLRVTLDEWKAYKSNFTEGASWSPPKACPLSWSVPP
ncbi:hypothetical protein AMTRI_Chr03g50900 [Amborella trichopoda]|uniref:Nucleotide-diphospho-sugar transferase domain-containing protein n=1 Tax=Amborella trichopoda TaxID=13333 RepID=U5D0A0_AMBTC|nr:uncharacterized protein At4g15970 [Amborella trichopoda]XP_011626967.1 uncharacterized protein At4g15970 [Amborella trichopoda]XP_020529091.1 uncharacterized protein At4g15970 [Amborella trichopoda]ERN15660.1 hypothetical protein AMTR_s00048p00206850 [Amborella trichopoda]|eukprot:XP_011626965.1 uncharacterized protein At4g15970 [Amborella trichopoda]